MTNGVSRSLVFTPPCLATAVDTPPEGDNWVHETKFDGYRLQVMIEQCRPQLLTRSGLNWTTRFGVLADELASLGSASAVIDGEAVVLDADGVSNFSALQQELKKGERARIAYMAFDLLHLDGMNIAARPLLERKTHLRRLLSKRRAKNRLVHLVEHSVRSGAENLAKACASGLEGIVSKRTDLRYRSGRHGEWTKTKCSMTAPFVVFGYVPSKIAGLVGSLVLGFFDAESAVYAGRVGTGFSTSEARAMAEGLSAIHAKPPLFVLRLTREQCADVVWIKPVLVAEVTYRDVTADKVLRHAVFVRFRTDLPADHVMRPAGSDFQVP
jgi:bifunctional non-homologous end joining protein LigD